METLQSDFEQAAFIASAGALHASHAVIDAIWNTYFPELPKDRPELRTLLIDLNQKALSGEPFNVGEAKKHICTRFAVAAGTADHWLDILQDECKFTVRLPARLPSDKKSEFHIVPTTEVKYGLYKVGTEYLACVRLMFHHLRSAMKYRATDVSDLDWVDDLKSILQTDVIDYFTISSKEISSKK